jgi:putative aldouronate transport system permease protein
LAIQKSTGYKIFTCLNVLFMLLVCVLVLFPYLNVLAIALNDNAKVPHTGLMLIPQRFTLANFQALLADSTIWHSAGVTLLRLAVGVPLTILINFTGSYALSKPYLPGRKGLVMLLMIPSYISAGLIPTYVLYSYLHLLNSFWVYVLPVGFWFFGFILLRTYLLTIPDSLEESAKLDGANDFWIMSRIYLPLSLPILATLVLFTSVTHWNDWTTTLYFITNYKNYSTLAFELQRVLREQDRIAKLVQEAIKNGVLPPATSTGTSEGLRNAQIIVTTLPIILVYPFLQRYFIQGMMVGSVKE